ncbi:Mur ligase domain-containing protein, partial [bacterium]|nr:Mur ligase domain-containing protein [bacterium]
MLLKQLLKGLDCTLVQGDLNTDVTDVYYDSRKVTTGGLFVCIAGTQRDSHDYAADVVRKGAAALVIQHDLPAGVLAAMPNVAVVRFPNTRYALAMLST